MRYSSPDDLVPAPEPARSEPSRRRRRSSESSDRGQRRPRAVPTAEAPRPGRRKRGFPPTSRRLSTTSSPHITNLAPTTSPSAGSHTGGGLEEKDVPSSRRGRSRSQSRTAPSMSETSSLPSQRTPSPCTEPCPGTSFIAWMLNVTKASLKQSGRGPLKGHAPLCGIFSDEFDHELDAAIKANDPVAVVKRLEAGADPHQTCGVFKATTLAIAALHNAFDVISPLCAAGANPECIDGFSNTALHVATFYGHPECIYKLCENGCDPNKRINLPWFLNFMGRRLMKCTAIYFATSFFEHAPTVQALLECGADPRIRNRARMSAIEAVGDSLEAQKIAKILERWERYHPEKAPSMED